MKVTPEDLGISGARLYKIDHLTRRYIEEGKLAGTISLVARKGQIAHLQCQGKMDIEADKAMTEDAIFRIHSMTKPITSTALMMLYEDGNFQLNDPVSRYIPKFKDLKTHDGSSLEREMTIRDLLTHTSGLTYGFMHANPIDKMYRDQGVEQSDSLEEMVDKLSEIPLLFTPGSRWNYSVSTDVCGYLVQKISDIPFDVFLKEQILDPLGMVDTDFYVPEEKVHRLCSSYEHTKGDGVQLLDPAESSSYLKKPKMPSGGDGLVSTAQDYFRFGQMMLNGGEIDGVQILGKKTVELMTQNHLPENVDLNAMGQSSFSETSFDGVGFGLGFSVMLDPAKAQILGSKGEFSWGGLASTFFFVDPNEDLLVILLTQLVPSTTYPIRRELRVTAYQTLID
ncbi:MAG: CubicO group peptidase (beta-lactamase class C family) [Candidatus Azotimanducaceae bacterium]|jgi:CubicO group peptidase (beta-lactamase class C family)